MIMKDTQTIIFLIFTMIFFHIVDDYYLQGLLAKMKQRQWWEINAPKKMYRYDYIPALIVHSFSWSFMIHIPLLIYNYKFFISLQYSLIISIIVNTIMHALIDDAKANKLSINLIQDQLMHLIQIIITALFYIHLR